MTPLAEPLRTYYAAIVWDGGYAGLQRRGSRFDRQLQFSLWDRPEGPAVLVIGANLDTHPQMRMVACQLVGRTLTYDDLTA